MTHQGLDRPRSSAEWTTLPARKAIPRVVIIDRTLIPTERLSLDDVMTVLPSDSAIIASKTPRHRERKRAQQRPCPQKRCSDIKHVKNDGRPPVRAPNSYFPATPSHP